jgi:hypothetical protein
MSNNSTDRGSTGQVVTSLALRSSAESNSGPGNDSQSGRGTGHRVHGSDQGSTYSSASRSGGESHAGAEQGQLFPIPENVIVITGREGDLNLYADLLRPDPLMTFHGGCFFGLFGQPIPPFHGVFELRPGLWMESAGFGEGIPFRFEDEPERLPLLPMRINATLAVEWFESMAFYNPWGRLPWLDPVDGHQVLDEIQATLLANLDIRPEDAAAMALYAAHTYSFNDFNVTGYLALLSPTMRCGKTRACTMLAQLVQNPMACSNTTGAGVYQMVQSSFPCTVIVDELDSHMRSNHDLLNVLLSGQTKQMGYVQRKGKRSWCWGPKIFGAIGSLPDRLLDRNIVIPMRRSKAERKFSTLDNGQLEALAILGRKLCRWAEDNQPAITSARPSLPEALTSSRARDCWYPLLAVADVIGGRWSELARQVAVLLSGQGKQEPETRVLLLRDMRKCFAALGNPVVPSAEVINWLVEQEERPWSSFKGGGALNTMDLANMLRPFDIHTHDTRIGEKVLKCYGKADFQDAWTRYLDNAEEGVPEDGTATPTPEAAHQAELIFLEASPKRRQKMGFGPETVIHPPPP